MSSFYDMRQAEAADAAGRPTRETNAACTAYDYQPGKLDHGRSFLMDDYVRSGRVTRRVDGPMAHMKKDVCWDLLQYQTDTTQFVPKQGFTETKFHSGFMRRQATNIPFAAEREARGRKTNPLTLMFDGEVERPGRRMMPSGPPVDVITGDGVTKNLHHGERRHIVDAADQRGQGLYADAPGGRLRDSTSRFFCTPDQLPHRNARQHTLETDGLVTTKRTSTVIGVGANPSQEIFSVGVKEALGDSLYGLQRRQRAAEARAAARSHAADVASVHALS